MDEIRQLSIRNVVVSSWSKFLLKGTGLSYLLDSFFFWSELSDFRWVSDQKAAFWLPLGRANIFQQKRNKKNEKKIMRSKWSLIRTNCVWRHLLSDPIALEVASDQTKVRSNPPMIRPNCARNFLWSDPSALESAYDQTFQTKMTSDQTISRPWSDRSALEVPKRPCNFGLGTHGCALDWVWSEVNLGLDLNLGWN